ncbi:hypothetical protein TNCV_4940461 [Trichonephila clavipes]|nr:hypothetical protein TNCV_4940461 [Trichonephila clavipes]
MCTSFSGDFRRNSINAILALDAFGYPGDNTRRREDGRPGEKKNNRHKKLDPLLRLRHEASKPCLPDSLDHPIAVMPPSRMQNTTLAMPLIEDLSRYGIENYSYSPEAQKSNAY